MPCWLPSACGPLAQLAEQRTFNPLHRRAWCPSNRGFGDVYLPILGAGASVIAAWCRTGPNSGSCVARRTGPLRPHHHPDTQTVWLDQPCNPVDALPGRTDQCRRSLRSTESSAGRRCLVGGWPPSWRGTTPAVAVNNGVGASARSRPGARRVASRGCTGCRVGAGAARRPRRPRRPAGPVRVGLGLGLGRGVRRVGWRADPSGHTGRTSREIIGLGAGPGRCG